MHHTPNVAALAVALGSIAIDKGRQFATVRAGDLKHPPDWIRKDAGTKEERTALARSYQARPINLILISPDGMIRDGNRRVAAIVEDAGPDTPVQVCVTAEQITPEVSLEIMLETAEHTKALTHYEKFVGYSRWLQLTGATARELAAKAHLSEGTVSNILSLSKCHPPTHEAAKAGDIGPTEWAVIARSTDQQAALDMFLSGETRAKVKEKTGRKGGATKAERTTRIRIPLDVRTKERSVSGMASIVGPPGKAIGLAEAENILREALKAVRGARAEKLDVATFEAVMADKARPGMAGDDEEEGP